MTPLMILWLFAEQVDEALHYLKDLDNRCYIGTPKALVYWFQASLGHDSTSII